MTLPIVAEITGFALHAERADWMIRCPDWHVVASAASIRRGLELVVFPEAVTYLEARLACLHAVRSRDGAIPNTILTPLYIREGEMREAARRRDHGPPIGGADLSRAGPTATPPEGRKRDGESNG